MVEKKTTDADLRDRELIELGRRTELLAAIRDVVSDEFRKTLPEIVRPVVRDEIRFMMARYYGDREPEEILNVIRNAERFQNRLAEITDSFWKTALHFLWKWALWIFLALFFVSHAPTWHSATLFPEPILDNK